MPGRYSPLVDVRRLRETRPTTRIGTAGWSLPKPHAHNFPRDGSHLQRYATMFPSTEINSSFHRPHMRKTWERWAASTPEHFRFAVKLPKSITHTSRLENSGALLQIFLEQLKGLGKKLGPLLIQLPPSLNFDEGVAHEFFTTLRELHPMSAVVEPRHASWFAPEVDRFLREFEVARVAADPPKASIRAASPGGWLGLRYFRLHGSPRTYYSDYSEDFLEQFSRIAESPRTETWVIFDNTALGHATGNALRLQELLHLAVPKKQDAKF